MTTVLITGCNRGIGFNLVRQFLKHANPPKILIATCRNPESATSLQELTKSHPNLKIVKLDVDDIDNYPKLVDEVTSLVGEAGLNLLINNAGISLKKERYDLTWQDYQRVFHTNTIAPIFLSQAFLPLIKKAAMVNNKSPLGINKAAIVNMTSFLGSVSQNYGGHHSYREAKAALNQSGRSLAVEVGPDGILVVNVHPGWVRTDLGGPEAPLSVEESTTGLINVIYNLKESDHNSYIDFSGKTLPW